MYINFCLNSLVHIATMRVSRLLNIYVVRAKQGIENVVPYKGTQTLTIRLTYFIRRAGSILSFVKYISKIFLFAWLGSSQVGISHWSHWRASTWLQEPGQEPLEGQVLLNTHVDKVLPMGWLENLLVSKEPDHRLQITSKPIVLKGVASRSGLFHWSD